MADGIRPDEVGGPLRGCGTDDPCGPPPGHPPAGSQLWSGRYERDPALDRAIFAAQAASPPETNRVLLGPRRRYGAWPPPRDGERKRRADVHARGVASHPDRCVRPGGPDHRDSGAPVPRVAGSAACDGGDISVGEASSRRGRDLSWEQRKGPTRVGIRAAAPRRRPPRNASAGDAVARNRFRGELIELS